MRGSLWAALALGMSLALALATVVDGARLTGASQPDRDASRQLATGLGLTDLALFNEARYTRHPSQADRHAAFQDHPLALDHFPAGSLQPPPP